MTGAGVEDGGQGQDQSQGQSQGRSQGRSHGRDRGGSGRYWRYQPLSGSGRPSEPPVKPSADPADSASPHGPEVSDEVSEGFPFDVPVEVGADGFPTGVELEVPADEPDRISEPFDPEIMQIQTQYETVDLLLSRLRERMIDLAPDFQRRAGIWSDDRQSRLIESLLLRIPVSSFYMAEQQDDEWAVVDGIQRLTAIARFMEPETIHSPPLQLQGLDYLRQFHGMGYGDLSGRLRIRLRETQVVVHVIRRGTPEAVKFNVFSRINTGGMPLTSQEIRHAMIPGPVRGFLGDLAGEPAFVEATGGSVSNERMSDREMVLRFLAFRLSPPGGYRQQDFDQFLADSMHAVNDLGDGERQALAREFRESMKCASALFGEHAFRKSLVGDRRKTPVNKALFEATAVNLAALDDDCRHRLVAFRDDVVARFVPLVKDWDFDRAISISTGDPKRVRKRFTDVEELLQGVLSGD